MGSATSGGSGRDAGDMGCVTGSIMGIWRLYSGGLDPGSWGGELGSPASHLSCSIRYIFYWSNKTMLGMPGGASLHLFHHHHRRIHTHFTTSHLRSSLHHLLPWSSSKPIYIAQHYPTTRLCQLALGSVRYHFPALKRKSWFPLCLPWHVLLALKDSLTLFLRCGLKALNQIDIKQLAWRSCDICTLRPHSLPRAVTLGQWRKSMWKMWSG